MQSDEGVLACLRLFLARGVGPYIGNQLLETHGSAVEFWQAGPDAWLQQDGVGPKLVAALQQSTVDAAQVIVEQCNKQSIHLLVRDDPAYPASLAQVDDAPLLLFVAGAVDALQQPRCLGVVGARKASQEGRLQTRRWCSQFSAKKVCIISGMAYGIDTAAHGGALEGPTATIAILGCGLSTLYPMQQRQLRAIADHGGCLVSEYLPNQAARPEHFPQRNRIIAALSQATLVMEADVASGSLITARHAARYGREVFAVPGSVLNQSHAGCHQLIRDGAQLVESPDDILQQLQWSSVATVSDDAHVLPVLADDADPDELLIVQALQHDVLHLDHLAERCSRTVPELASRLLSLELQGVIESLPGCRYALRR